MELLPAIADERRTLADMLSTLTEKQWAAASLCDGWTVRHVAAHLVMPFRLSIPKVIWEMIKAKGDFNKVNACFAQRNVLLNTSDLVAELRRNADHRFKPPGFGHEAPLIDLVIHGLDIRRPLGIERTLPPERWTVVLDHLLSPKQQRFFGDKVNGLTFLAADIGWSKGSGPEVRGKAEDLALLFAGRRGALDRLEGDGVGVLRTRGLR